MDSSFVNYDGRSVHDMIESLLAMSGDPEAITRLQQAIQAVDNKFGPVDTELARLEEDKQDAGDYVENGGGDFSWLPFLRGSYIARMNRGNNTEGIRIYGQYEKEESGYNLDGLVFNRATKQILHQAYNADTSTWDNIATYSADEDTGWLTIEGDVSDVDYRKKNGVVFLRASGTIKAAFPNVTPVIVSLPAGFRPSAATFFTYTTRKRTANYEYKITNYGFIEPNGAVRLHVNAIGDVTDGDQLIINVSYTV